MQALEFWKAVTADRANLLERLIGLLEEHRIRYCVIGGQAVNAYSEPVVTLDLDIAIALDQLELARNVLQQEFKVRECPHRLNLSALGSDLRVQIQANPETFSYIDRATEKYVLGLRLPVAAIEDVLEGKIRVAQELTRRPSRQIKDLADIARLLEAQPDLERMIPTDIRARIEAAQAKG
jgi:hypothetical protein